jgi:hypothetical protein
MDAGYADILKSATVRNSGGERMPNDFRSNRRLSGLIWQHVRYADFADM